MRRLALSTQILAVNSLLIAATVLASVAVALRPSDAVDDGRPALVLLGAIVATVLVNALVLRRRFAPLENVIATMERVDLATPGLRVPGARADSTEVARLHDAFNRMLERLEDERVGAASAVLRAQEGERARLARDLHDEVNQALTGVLLRLQATAQAAPPSVAEELRETQRVATQAMDELRRLAHELRPAALDDHGLTAALRTQIDGFARKTGMTATLELSGDVDTFRPDEQLVVYRVVQECLSNVARHAEARSVHVDVRRKGARGTVRVVDDGCGISERAQRGLGLTGMRERALQAGGRLDVQTAPGRGTTIELLLGRTAPPAQTTTISRRAWA
jgi:two-component system sensor histidine kinase UhpB